MKVQILSRPDKSKGIKVATGIKILNLPGNGCQNLTNKTLQDFKQFISKTDEAITFHTLDGDVVFRIEHAPGRYCLTCDEKLPDARDDRRDENKALDHVEKQHGGEASKSERWPHGYAVFAHHYQCIIEDQRHG